MANGDTTATVNGVDSELSPSQLERRQRMLDAALQLAAKGGYEAVQMRDVADRAEVALGTLYRYFPSKVHLLVTSMLDQLTALADRLEKNPPGGDSPADRVINVLSRATRTLQLEPQLTDALTRSLMSADASAATEVDAVSAQVSRIIVSAIHGGADAETTAEDLAIARVIEQVWMSSILAWLSGRSSTKQMTDDLEVASRLLLR